MVTMTVLEFCAMLGACFVAGFVLAIALTAYLVTTEDPETHAPKP